MNILPNLFSIQILRKFMEFVTIEELPHFLAAVGSFKGAIKTAHSFSSLEANCYANVVAGTVYQFDSSNFSINRYEAP